MQAIRLTAFGSPDVLQLVEVAQPVPQADQVLVEVVAASVNALDYHGMRNPPGMMRLMSGNGLRTPTDQRMGVDLAGRVAAVGSAVTQFQPGDAVFGRGIGAFAQFATAREKALVKKPDAISFEQAAAVPIAGLTALQALRDKGNLQAGQQVLIYGAGGGVGTFAVQIARALGAHVTAVCGPAHVEMMHALAVDEVIDYTRQDALRTGKQYDLILGINGYHALRAYQRVLRPAGTYVMIGAAKSRLFYALFQVMFLGPALSRFSGKRLRFFVAAPTQPDLATLAEWIAAGKIVPQIDRTFPLAETAAAMAYAEAGHIRGKIIITMEQADHT